jgi:signal transduction histidine kinase
MPAAPKPANEQERLKSLSSYAILDTPPDQAFDDLVEVASYICGTPLAAVSLVDTDRQWFKARLGLDEKETSRDVSFCGHAILHEELFEVPNALADLRFADNPLVSGEMGLRFYAGVPLITSDNFALGTLCVFDREPRQLSGPQREALQALSRQAVAMLERHKAFLRIQELARQKEEFLRVASHDLKNPLQAIFGATELLELYTEAEQSSPRLRDCVTIISERAGAMQQIIQDFVDGHALEDGQLQLHRERVDLAALAQRVIGGHVISAQGKGISLSLTAPVEVAARVDRARIAQVLENLIGNAVKFSPQGSAVTVRLSSAEGRVRAEVVDAGPGLSEADRARLFTRYGRLSAQPTAGEASTGLGLVISRQLIEAHGGVIGAHNNDDRGATFWFEVSA